MDKIDIIFLRTQGILLVAATTTFLTGFVAATVLKAYFLGYVAISVSVCLLIVFFLMIGRYSKKLAAKNKKGD